MKFLREHGIVEEGDPLLHGGRSTVGADAFFAGAERMLRTLGPFVQSEIVPALPSHRARWHPTGFMVYPLGAHPVYGTLRFHIWPAGQRRRVLQGRGDLGDIWDGDIHTHSWNITSLVLTSYVDNIYTVRPAGEEEADRAADDPELFRRFTVAYHPGSYQSLVTDGRRVLAHTAESRAVTVGEIHTILANVFHAPVVPLDTAGATLVFSSPRVQSTGPDVLIGGSGDAVEGPRHEVMAGEAHEARNQLRALGVG